MTGKEAECITQAVASGKISGNGEFTKKCQVFFEKRYGFKKCLLTTSCTDALEMAAVPVQNGIGKVGLVAVDAKSCGKGIGTALLYDLDRYLISKGVDVCDVVTQGMNIAARHLYEKVGFRLQSQVEVWHIWKSWC